MKKKLLTLALSLMLFGALHAQLKVGGGLWYGTDIDNFGISANATYLFNEQWSAAPSFTFFLPKDNMNWSVIDLDANYTFADIEKLGKVYALAGLSINFWSYDFDGDEYFDLDTSGSEAGLNIGAGFKTEINKKIVLAPEIRYTFGDCDYLRIGAKILFLLNK